MYFALISLALCAVSCAAPVTRSTHPLSRAEARNGELETSILSLQDSPLVDVEKIKSALQGSNSKSRKASPATLREDWSADQRRLSDSNFEATLSDVEGILASSALAKDKVRMIRDTIVAP